MRFIGSNLICAAAAFSLLSLPAGASTMTFGGLGAFESSYSENGVLAKAGSGLFNGDGPLDPGKLHLDDGGSGNPAMVTFSTGGIFNAISFLLDPLGFDYKTCDADWNCTAATFANVSVTGYQADGGIVSMVFDMSVMSGKIDLAGSFTKLTSLVIGFAALPSSDADMCGAPCSHFLVDDVVLAPVPLPAGFPLLAAGIMAVGAIGLRRRASRS